MVPSTRRRQARSGQVLSISVLVGVLAVALGTVTVVSIYLNRMSSSVESMARAEPLGGYDGRPEKAAPKAGSSPPVDYLVMVADEHDELLSVHLVQLSGSRQNLTLVGLPSDLLVPYGPGQPQQTIASYYRGGTAAVAQQIELLLGVRTDHQVRLGLDGFSGVANALGGLDGLDGQARSGRDLLNHVAAAEDGPGRVERVSEIVQLTMQRLGMMHAVTNPVQFDNVLRALEDCTLVDSDLTVDEFEATVMESSVRADEIGAVTLASTPTAGGRMALPGHLAKLRKAIATDNVSALARPIAPTTSTPTAKR